MKYKIPFGISIIVLLVSLSMLMPLNYNLKTLNITGDFVTEKNIENALSILEECDFSPDKKNEIQDRLFNAKQLLLLENDRLEATKVYDSVRSDISSCQREQPVQPLFGEYDEIVSSGLPVASFVSSVIFGILGLKKDG